MVWAIEQTLSDQVPAFEPSMVRPRFPFEFAIVTTYVWPGTYLLFDKSAGLKDKVRAVDSVGVTPITVPALFCAGGTTEWQKEV